MHFKVNSQIWAIIQASKMSSTFVSCSPLCDRQVISGQNLMSCLRQIRCLKEAIDKKLEVQADVYPTTENNKESEEERKVRETKRILSRAVGVRSLKQTEID